MQYLNFLERVFEEFTLKVKLIFILLPLLFSTIIFFLIDEEKRKIEFEDYHIESYKIDKKMQRSISFIIKDIEEFCVKKSINILLLKSLENGIKMHVKAKMVDILFFIKYIEDYNSFSNIKSLKIEENSLNIEIDFSKLFLKKNSDINSRIKKLEREKRINFKLNAIVDNKALINKQWYKIGSMLGEFKITGIYKNRVLLINKNQNISLGLYKDE